MIDVSKHIGLVSSIAMRLTKLRPIEDTEEFGWGIDGLMHAAEKFEPERNFKFSTYATWCIRGYIMNQQRRQSRTTCVGNFVLEAKEELDKKAHFIAWDILDSYPVKTVDDAVNRQIIIDYYIHGLLLREIGSKLGLTKERVRQRKLEALEVLAKQAA